MDSISRRKRFDEDHNLFDNGSIWQESPIQYKDFSISFNKVDYDLEHGYLEEVKELKEQLLHEFNSISSESHKQKSSLDTNQVINAAYNTDIFFSVLGFQNNSLIERKNEPMDFKEFETFLCCFFGLCFYCYSLSDVLKHPHADPILTNTVQGLNSSSSNLDIMISQMNDLLRSFEGHGNSFLSRGNTDQTDQGVFWSPIYGIGRNIA